MATINSCCISNHSCNIRLPLSDIDWNDGTPWEFMWTTGEKFICSFEYHPWFFSILGSLIVGLAGVFPLLLFPIDVKDYQNKQGGSSRLMKILLSFAVGGLLGDVFLHLLPEAWENFAISSTTNKSGHPSMACGLWVLGGFLVFVIAEKIFIGNDAEEVFDTPGNDVQYNGITTNILKRANNEKDNEYNNNYSVQPGINIRNGWKVNRLTNKINGVTKVNGYKNGCVSITQANTIMKCNGLSKGFLEYTEKPKVNEFKLLDKVIDQIKVKEKPKHITGYLNLMANCVDNFTHGLAVGGSFLVSFRLGALTTFAILIHEIPHEIGDFAILLRSGFSRLDAAKAQIITASGGLCGAFVALIFSGDAVEAKTSWILPFTAGGFLHIGMVTVLPELLRETDPRESLKQLCASFIGIIVMAVLTILVD